MLKDPHLGKVLTQLEGGSGGVDDTESKTSYVTRDSGKGETEGTDVGGQVPGSRKVLDLVVNFIFQKFQLISSFFQKFEILIKNLNFQVKNPELKELDSISLWNSTKFS